MNYFFAKDDFQKLVDQFNELRSKEADKKELKGFVTEIGTNDQGHPRMFLNPLYCDGSIADPGDKLVVENKNGSVCPYPPGY